MKRIRIKDIAERAGVSTGTVDRVLHQRGDVSAKARTKVEAAMEELGYEPNALASALAYNRTLTIAVLLPFPDADDYWQAINQGIRKAGQALQHFGLNLRPIYFELASPRHFSECANRLLAESPAGFLFAPVFQLEGADLCRQLQARAIPYVMINTRLAEANALCFIGQDAYQAGYLAGKLASTLLQESKETWILHLEKGVDNAPHLLAKAHGFQTYFKEEGLQDQAVRTLNIAAYDNPETLAKQWSREVLMYGMPACVFVTNSRAHHLIEALQLNEMEAPAVLGFDPIPANLECLKHGTIQYLINQHPKAQGYLGMVALSNFLLKKVKAAPDTLLPLDIVVKENMSYLNDWGEVMRII